MKKISILILFSFFFACTVDSESPPAENVESAKGDALKGPIVTPDTDTNVAKDTDINVTKIDDTGKRDTKISLVTPPEPDVVIEEIIEEVAVEIEEEPDLYPPGPYSVELFSVLPDMVFYDPWDKAWIRISEYYKHPDHKALLIVSSAGWCGPCQLKATELVDLYDKYHDDGLEVAYTLMQSFDLLDWIFTNPDNEEADLNFMEQWKEVPLYYGQVNPIQYPLYADPGQALNPYVPPNEYGIPFSILITTDDMGIRYIGKGYAPNVLENKIMLVLYNELPKLPFE